METLQTEVVEKLQVKLGLETEVEVEDDKVGGGDSCANGMPSSQEESHVLLD